MSNGIYLDGLSTDGQVAGQEQHVSCTQPHQQLAEHRAHHLEMSTKLEICNFVSKCLKGCYEM